MREPRGSGNLQLIPSRLRGALGALALAGGAAGCTVETPVALNSSAVPAKTISGIAFLAHDEDAPQMRRDFASALKNALSKKGVSLDTSASVLGDFAIAVSDAQSGLVMEGGLPEGSAADPDSIDWAAHPRAKRWLDECEAKRVRATLLLIERDSGAIVYRGEATKLACDVTGSVLENVAEELASAATAAP